MFGFLFGRFIVSGFFVTCFGCFFVFFPGAICPAFGTVWSQNLPSYLQQFGTRTRTIQFCMVFATCWHSNLSFCMVLAAFLALQPFMCMVLAAFWQSKCSRWFLEGLLGLSLEVSLEFHSLFFSVRQRKDIDTIEIQYRLNEIGYRQDRYRIQLRGRQDG